jgi:chromosome segregation ATPase
MRRAFVLPVSAAVVGALLAIGVSAIDRSFDRSHDRVHVIRTVDEVDFAEIDIDLSEVEEQIAEAMELVEEIQIDTEVRVQKDMLREVREQLRTELRFNADAREMTEAEQERLREAMEQLEEELPAMMGIAELVEGLTREDGSAHKRPSRN